MVYFARRTQPATRRRKNARLELQPLEEHSLLTGYQQINRVGYQPGWRPIPTPT